MNYLVFDIETTTPIGPEGVAGLEISVISIYNSADDSMQSFLVKDFGSMWKLFEHADALVGYNSEHFDIPLLNKYYPGDLTKIKSIDLMVHIKESFGRRAKLDDIAAATLGKKKISHGLQAVTWWEEGKIDKIIKYCEEDVRITKEVFDFALKNGFVKLKNYNGEIIEIPIKTDGWTEKEDVSITHSFGF